MQIIYIIMAGLAISPLHKLIIVDSFCFHFITITSYPTFVCLFREHSFSESTTASTAPIGKSAEGIIGRDFRGSEKINRVEKGNKNIMVRVVMKRRISAM